MPDRFAAAGYGDREVGFGALTGVLVVDFQVGLTCPKFSTGQSPQIHAAVEHTAQLVAAARRVGAPVALCNLAWSRVEAMPYWKIGAAYGGMAPGDPATQLDSRVHDPGYDFSFTKVAPSAFFGTPLMTFLVRNRVDTLVVAGCMTSGCVRASVVDSFSHGLRTIVAPECVGDMEREPHEANLTDMARRYADLVPLETILARLTAPSPQA